MTTAESLELEVSDVGGLKRSLTFQVPARAVAEATREACDQIGGSTRLPGFRNGHVPRKVVLARFGNQVRQEVLERVVPDYYRRALEQADLTPLTSPQFGPLEPKDGEPLTVSASFEVRPEIDLAPYDGLELSAVDPVVTDDDLSTAHKSLLDSMAAVVPSAPDHVAENGDVAVIDFVGTLDGELFDGGSGEGHALTLGEGRFIPGFEEQVAGHQAGDVFDIDVTFPADYHAAELAGKAARFNVTLQEIKCKELPALDDDFATQVGDYADLDALNTALKEQITQRRATDQRRIHRHEVFAKLAEANEFAPPEAWVDEEIERIIDTRRRMEALAGRDPDAALDTDPEALRESLRPEAEIQARGRLVVGEIARREQIEVTSQEFAAECARLAHEYQRDPREVMDLIRQNPDETERLTHHLLRDKVMDRVIDQAAITHTGRPEKSGQETA